MTSENKRPRRTWAQTFAVYRDRRMAKILLLGFMSGLPWLFIGSMAALWLKEEGVSRTGIGLFGLVFAVYAVNALWAPAVEGVRIPWLANVLGRRRAWIITMQGVMLCALVAVSFIPGFQQWDLVVEQHGDITAALPQVGINLWFFALVLFIIATASATQDIAIDACRIELINTDEPQKIIAGSAMTTSGWWLGFGGGKALALPLVVFFQNTGVIRAWQAGYLAMAVVVIISAVMLVLFVREGDNNDAADDNDNVRGDNKSVREQSAPVFNPLALLRRVVFLWWLPLRDFVWRYGGRAALMLLFFIFFFKIGEAFLGRMSLVFYKEIGFSKLQIAWSGGLGTVTVCIFAVLGSFINTRYGLFRGIVLAGIAMAGTNLLFAVLYYYPEQWLFFVTVVVDQFTTTISTVAFVAFISQLCDRRHTASQYAAFASLGNLSRTTLAASSGALVDGLGGNWAVFFVITVMMVMPSLLILAAARKTLRPIMTGATTKVI
ncbi:MAG: MFS transporter [Gammaproteobacteria bacterium]